MHEKFGAFPQVDTSMHSLTYLTLFSKLMMHTDTSVDRLLLNMHVFLQSSSFKPFPGVFMLYFWENLVHFGPIAEMNRLESASARSIKTPLKRNLNILATCLKITQKCNMLAQNAIH